MRAGVYGSISQSQPKSLPQIERAFASLRCRQARIGTLNRRGVCVAQTADSAVSRVANPRALGHSLPPKTRARCRLALGEAAGWATCATIALFIGSRRSLGPGVPRQIGNPHIRVEFDIRRVDGPVVQGEQANLSVGFREVAQRLEVGSQNARDAALGGEDLGYK